MTSTQDHSTARADAIQAMAEELGRHLAQQIVCVREGNLDGVERIAARTDVLVAGIVSGRSSGAVPTASQKAHLKRLYEDLTLALRAERDDVQTKMRQLRQVKKAVGAYGREGGARQASDPMALDETNGP